MNSKHVKVAIVDDEKSAYSLLKAILNSINQDVKLFYYEYTWFESIDSALHAFSTENFDIALVDYHLGEGSGLEFISCCKALNIDCACIILTGYSHIHLDQESMLAGAADFLPKSELNKDMLERILRHSYQNHKLQHSLNTLNQNLEKQVEQRAQQLNTMQNQLIEAEKIGLLSTIVPAFIHDISSPVGVCKIAAETIQDKSEELTQLLENKTLSADTLGQGLAFINESGSLIRSSLEKAVELIGSFKTVSIDNATQEKRVFNIKQYLNDILITLKPKLKLGSYTINLNCPNEININSYPVVFYQIMLNLINNSINHGFSKDNRGTVDIDIVIKNEHLMLDYKDNGSGVSLNIIKTLFEPYVTTAKDKGGSGLGTAIIRSAVEDTLKGDIKFHSEPNKGVHFIIRFPVELVNI